MQKAPKFFNLKASCDGDKASSYSPKNNHKPPFCQGICAQCVYFRSVITKRSLMHSFCRFTGEDAIPSAIACQFFVSKVGVYAW